MANEKHDKKELLNSEEKGVGAAIGLSVIWRKLLQALRIRPDTWCNHMNHYLNDPTNKIGSDSKARSTIRGNLEKSLFSDESLTWSRFPPGIKIIGYSLRSVRMEIHVETSRGEKMVITHDLLRPKGENQARKRKQL